MAREGMAGLVLAGGRSTRFGSEKAAALVEGRPLLAYAHAALSQVCDDVAVSAAPGSQAERLGQALGLSVLHDAPGHVSGPLAGVAQGLTWAARLGAARLALLPCDTPRVDAAMLARLAATLDDGHGAAAAQTADGVHALCAVLRVEPAAALVATLAQDDHPPVRALWERLGLALVRFDDAAAFLNVNRVEDLET